ncbi:MAG: hypothetical protein HY860_01470 [Chlamydiales bacterium]|nr:hypothetical protein [Chlamydiales bacterium]
MLKELEKNSPIVFHNIRYAQIGYDLLEEVFSIKKNASLEELQVPAFIMRKIGEKEEFQVVIIAYKHDHTVKFCYEMLRKWAIPGYMVSFSHFMVSDFDYDQDSYSLLDVGFCLPPSLSSQIIDNMELFEEEMCLGLSSYYQASKILEIKGMNSEEKFLHMQERIFYYLSRFSSFIDYDIIPFMQSVFLSFSESFKAIRSEKHLSRVVLSLYFLEKSFDQHKFANMRIKKTAIQDLFGLKDIACISICFKALSDIDVFEKKEMFQFLSAYFPSIRLLEESFFIKQMPAKDVTYLYVELEKSEREPFSKRDLDFLEELLPISIQKSIHQFVKPLLIPRNEEELYKNMIILGSQLRYRKDLPQVMISYEQKIKDKWEFSVLIACLDVGFLKQIDKITTQEGVYLQLEKTKTIGMIRKKYPKEGVILKGYVVGDGSKEQLIDYYEARKKVAYEIKNIIGAFRDFNGGMIEKQMEKLAEIKNLIDVDQRTIELLEKFFISIKQREYIAVWDTSILIAFFALFKKACNNIFATQQDWIEENLEYTWMGIGVFSDKKLYEKNLQLVAKMNIASHQYLSIALQHMQKYVYGVLIKRDFIELNELKMHLDML